MMPKTGVEKPVAVTTSLTIWQWAIRIFIVAVELILAFWCCIQGELFFYQGF